MISPRPNLLYLVHRFPYPPNRGDRIRSFHLLKYLAEHYNVYLGTLWDEEPTEHERAVLHNLCAEVTAVPIGNSRRWLQAAGSLAVGKSATAGLFYSPELTAQIKHWMETVQFDWAMAFCSSMVQYLDSQHEIPTIVDLVDVDSQKWFDYAQHAHGWKRWMFRLEGKRLREFERSLPQRCQALTLVSESEAELFRNVCPNDRTFGISNGVDLEYFNLQTATSVDSSRSGCVFVGALDYRANVEGLEWFCEQCWPTIVEQRPETTLKLVGRNPVSKVRRLAELPGVQLVGQVPDVRPYLRKASVAIAPLLTARGIQNKVLEAMAMGSAVVASPQAIEGIHCQAGKHLLKAATEEDWIQTVVALLGDVARQTALGVAARGLVEQTYSWDVQLKRFGDLLGVLPVLPSVGEEVLPFAESQAAYETVRIGQTIKSVQKQCLVRGETE